MEERLSKKNSTPADASSPVLLRRRLSAPETIMRKHMLVQQRSQDGDIDHNSDVRSCNWRLESGVGSDTNLNRKRDIGFMRKSTLMRRLWGSSKPLSERSCRFSSYYDWQHAKSNLSLSSNNSSPEHTKSKCKCLSEDSKSFVSKRFKGTKLFQSFDLQKTPSMDKISRQSYSDNTYTPSSQIPESKSSCCSNCTNKKPHTVHTSSYDNRTTTTTTTSTTTRNTITTTETESEIYSTRSTSTTENSDSAYTNSRSNATHSSSDMYSNTYSTEKFIAENGNLSETECRNTNEIKHKSISEKLSDSSTQTTNATNLNVISNIQLSQATLNLIFNQVMQDVQKSPQTNINISTVSSGISPNLNNSSILKPQIIQVKQVPSFYLKGNENNIPDKEQQRRILKYMVSNVGAGSSYCKPVETPQVVVPRFSALPRTTSMEVNTSSGESSDRESDNISLVDSLEGSWSPSIDINQNKFSDRPLSPLLPDNSIKSDRVSEKSSSFFIPIETNVDTEIKSVADHLPDRVRERLSKRQIRRQQKIREAKDKIVSPKSDSNYISASDNGNVQNNINNNQYVTSTSTNLNKIKKKNKPLLPNIDSYKKHKNLTKTTFKNEEEIDNVKEKTKTRRRFFRSQECVTERSLGISKMHQKVLEKLSPLCGSKKDFSYTVIPNTVYHKTELTNSNKHIEILEIVECIGTMPDRSTKRYTKSKHSKIPILVQSKLPSISKDFQNQKPTFLDFDQVHKDEPKVDQLIANILIDALNKTELDSPEEKVKPLVNKIEKRPSASQVSQMRQGIKYQQKFEVIPEERGSAKTSSEDASNSSENGNDCKIQNTENGNILLEPSLENSSDGRFQKSENNLNKGVSTSAKGWVTFYTVHKKEGSSDSTPDEGRKERMSHDGTDNKHCLRGDRENLKKIVENIDTSKSQHVQQQNYNQTHIVPKSTMHDTLDCWSSSDQDKRMKALYPLPPIYRNNQQKKSRFKSSDSSRTNKTPTGEWTVTVSGVTSGKEFAPDLEMRLIFPHNKKNSRTQAQDENRRDTMSNKKCKTGISRTENFKNIDPLPDIAKYKSTKTPAASESSRLMGNCGIIEPRQTKTSTRRLLLNRPRTFAAPANYMEINVEDK